MEKRVLHGYEDENGETVFRPEGDGQAERADKVWIGKVRHTVIHAFCSTNGVST
jgi:hypothetical protein